ncbi:hypothetical protein GCM10027174_24190 [Salinifilum aidingensis]
MVPRHRAVVGRDHGRVPAALLAPQQACASVCFLVPAAAGFVPTVRHFSRVDRGAAETGADTSRTAAPSE